MSYYYEDTSHYCYSVPAHYVDTPSYSFYYETPPEPVYHDDITPEPTYYGETLSEPVYYNDVHLEPIYYDIDHPQLEHNMDSDIPVIEYYHEDEVHPAYRDHPNTTVEPLDVHTTSIHPPTETDDMIHMFDTFSEDELVEWTQFYGSELGRLSNLGYNLTEPCNGSINSLRFNKLTRRCQYIESLQRHRTKYDAEDDTKEERGDRDEDEDDDKTFPLPHLYSQEEVHPCYCDYNYLADTVLFRPIVHVTHHRAS
jgi:hypothetical protein